MSYERIVQWAAGPTAALSGWLAVQLTSHVGLFGQAGVSRQAAAAAIFKAVVFATTALTTYAAHHKWLSNLAKWWEHQPAAIPTAGEAESAALRDVSHLADTLAADPPA